MASSLTVNPEDVIMQIEELRRQLHEGFGSGYDPARLQALQPISAQLDRLAVELTRYELHQAPRPK